MEAISQLVTPWLQSYNVIFIATIDSRIPARHENLPNGDASIRIDYEVALADAVASFGKYCKFIHLPNSHEDRLLTIFEQLVKLGIVIT